MVTLFPDAHVTRRTRVLAVVALLGLAAAASAAPSSPSSETRLLEDYRELVDEYRRGESDRAITAIIGWTPEDMARVAGRLTAAQKSPAAPAKPAAMILAMFPAAVMLHTEAGLYLSWKGDGKAAWRQWSQALVVAETSPTEPQAEFLRAWYRAFGLFCTGSYIATDAIRVLDRGRARFPDDALLALALAQAYESRGTSLAGGGAGPAQVQASAADLNAAERIYRELLSGDPSQAEARLRLGRVLELRGQRDQALAEMREAAASSDKRVQYLSHLYAGDLLQRQSRTPEARPQLAQALVAWPSGQAAALSLAEILHAAGDVQAAAKTLATALGAGASMLTPDPFRTYQCGDRAEHKALLEALTLRARR
jgi:tetratricopeptide (TPR) repeat protein